MTVERFVRSLTGNSGRTARIGLVGFGVTGRALYEVLSPLGVEISVRCRNAAALPDGVRAFLGEGYLDGIYEDALLLSPSVRRDLPALLSAEGRGVTVSSDCEIFFSECARLDREDALTARESRLPTQIFAVTGSDGKTTVTRMAAEMLGAAAVGNVGTPFCTMEGYGRYVAELSSFNLSFFAPKSVGCALTNVTPNHLNWHVDLDEYRAAKANALKNAGYAVICADDEGSRTLMRGGETLFSLQYSREELLRLGARHAVYSDGGAVYYDGEPIVKIAELSLRERHNVLNFMAAVGLSHDYADPTRLREVGMTFRPPRHRCERVHTDGRGVEYVNSSIDTTPSRTATTLAGLDRRVLLLLGGRGKGLSPLPLCEPLVKYAEAIAVYGEWRGELISFIEGDERLRQIPLFECERFADALCALCDRAKKGQTVLLSPAATAYGEFENYEKRGDFFTSLVRERYP